MEPSVVKSFFALRYGLRPRYGWTHNMGPRPSFRPGRPLRSATQVGRLPVACGCGFREPAPLNAGSFPCANEQRHWNVRCPRGHVATDRAPASEGPQHVKPPAPLMPRAHDLTSAFIRQLPGTDRSCYLTRDIMDITVRLLAVLPLGPFSACDDGVSTTRPASPPEAAVTPRAPRAAAAATRVAVAPAA